MSEITCENCGKVNPAGAKFCSGCAAPLTAGAAGPSPNRPTPPPPPPPPPPPQKPGVAGMLGQTGGKVEQRQISGDAAQLFASAERFLNQREDTTIKSQYPPQQISASVMFKDFLATLNSPAKVDSEININPAGAGLCTVSIGSKVDWGSTMTVWVMSVVILIALIFLFNPYGMYTMLYLLLFAGGSVFQIFILSSRGPRTVAEAFFKHLDSDAGASTSASTPASGPAAGSEPAAPPKPAPAPEPTGPQASEAVVAAEPSESSAAVESGEGTPDIAERIKKLTELKEQGLITEDEYETRRAEILNEI